MDIDTTARVKSIKYNCITNRMEELTIGDVVPSFFDKQADIQRSVEKAIDIKDSSVRLLSMDNWQEISTPTEGCGIIPSNRMDL